MRSALCPESSPIKFNLNWPSLAIKERTSEMPMSGAGKTIPPFLSLGSLQLSGISGPSTIVFCLSAGIVSNLLLNGSGNIKLVAGDLPTFAILISKINLGSENVRPPCDRKPCSVSFYSRLVGMLQSEINESKAEQTNDGSAGSEPVKPFGYPDLSTPILLFASSMLLFFGCRMNAGESRVAPCFCCWSDGS